MPHSGTSEQTADNDRREAADRPVLRLGPAASNIQPPPSSTRGKAPAKLRNAGACVGVLFYLISLFPFICFIARWKRIAAAPLRR